MLSVWSQRGASCLRDPRETSGDFPWVSRAGGLTPPAGAVRAAAGARLELLLVSPKLSPFSVAGLTRYLSVEINRPFERTLSIHPESLSPR